MDSVFQIISTLNTDDKKEFSRFVDRVSQKGQNLVMELFGHFDNENLPAKEDVMQAIYGKQNYEAYKALRKRLLALLQRFIGLKLIDSDSSNTSQIINLVNMARYLQGHQLSDLAFKYLIKAERQAITYDVYEVLNSVYVFQIEYGEHLTNEETDLIIKKWRENKALLEKSERVEMAINIINRRIRSQNQESIEAIVTSTLADIDGADQILQEPRFLYQITLFNRRDLLRKKDFLGLGLFLEKQFEVLQRSRDQLPKGNYYYAGFLYMIAHIEYRNKQFDLSLNRLELLNDELTKLPEIRKREFEAKAVLLKAVNLQYTKKLDKAIKLLEEAAQMPCFFNSMKDEINRLANLAVAYALKLEYRKAKLLFLRINRTDNWLAKQMGEEWLLKRYMIESILYFELGDTVLLDSKLRTIKTKFKSLFKLPVYQRALVFVKFIEQINKVVLNDEKDKLSQKIEDSFEWTSTEAEDLQAMVFYSWLKSKLVSKDPYAVLMEMFE